MQRPDFTKDMTFSEFSKFYWYKTELQIICHEHHLPSVGTKAELNKYIKQFLDGKDSSKISITRNSKRTGDLLANLTPETKLLESGFCFNNEARQFFKDYYGLGHFSFKKAMAVKMREVEINHNTNATIQDLMDVYEHPPICETNKEEQTYQWNNFVKDFMADDESKKYNQPLKVAVLLWTDVKHSINNKEYSRELLKRNKSIINRYIKISDHLN